MHFSTNVKSIWHQHKVLIELKQTFPVHTISFPFSTLNHIYGSTIAHHHHRYSHRNYYRMERSTGGGQLPYPYNRMHMTTAAAAAAAAAVEHHGNITSSKPPKFRAISRTISMAIDNYDDVVAAGSGDSSTLIVEKPLIHRAASPVPISSFPQSQTLAPPATVLIHHGGVRASSADIIVSPALSARQRSYELHQQHSQTSPHSVSPVLSSRGSGSGRQHHQQQQQQQQQHKPELYVIDGGSLGDNIQENLRSFGGRSPPIGTIDDYPLPAMHIHHSATHPFKKSMLRRSDTIDVQSASSIQLKKTQSFHMAAGIHEAAADPLLLNTAKEQAANGITSSTSQRTSSLRSNFLMPGPPTATKDHSRSPSPSRRGHRSHRSVHEPIKRPDSRLNSVIDSQIRHPSLNDDLIDNTELASGLLPKAHMSLENDIFIDSHPYNKSHTKQNEVDVLSIPLHNLQEVRKASSSFEETYGSTSTSSLKKRETKSARQHSTQSLELNGRPSPTAETATAIATVLPTRSTLHLHSVAAATSAVHQFKRGKKHGRSLYLSPANLDELTMQHRPVLLAAAANFQGDNAKSLKQAKALYSASVRLRTYRESLSASKKSRSFIADDIFPATASNASNEFIELSSPHRFNAGVLKNAKTVDDVSSSPRLASSTSPIDFLNEKRPSFEKKASLAYDDTADTAFEQVLRPFHHKITAMPTTGTTAPSKHLHHSPIADDEAENERNSERKRKRIVCIVMIVFLCLMSASVFVVIMTLTHSSGQTHTHHHSTMFKKTYSYNRDVPVHYNEFVFTVRQENERLMKETLERGRFGRNYTDGAGATATAAATSLLTANTAALVITQRQQQQQQQQQQQAPGELP